MGVRGVLGYVRLCYAKCDNDEHSFCFAAYLKAKRQRKFSRDSRNTALYSTALLRLFSIFHNELYRCIFGRRYRSLYHTQVRLGQLAKGSQNVCVFSRCQPLHRTCISSDVRWIFCYLGVFERSADSFLYRRIVFVYHRCFYRRCCVYRKAASVCCYLFLLFWYVKERNKQLVPVLLIPLGMFLSMAALSAGTAYTEISAFHAIKCFYLAGAYPLMLAFEVVSLSCFFQVAAEQAHKRKKRSQ